MVGAFGLRVVLPGEPGDGDVRIVRGEVPDGAGETVLSLRQPTGEPFLTVAITDAGYRIDAPDYGRHLVSPDGRTVTMADGGDPEPLLVSQSLPTAAVLQGRDLLHASAVETASGVIAISAPSGSGKTTLAGRLIDAGLGRPFTDDVLAVTLEAGVVVAHPGPPPLGLGTARGGASRTPPVVGSRPLGALVLLDRTGGEGDVTLREEDAFTEVLATAFLPHLSPPARLLRRLEASAALVGERRVWRLVVPAGAGIDATVQALVSRLVPVDDGP